MRIAVPILAVLLLAGCAARPSVAPLPPHTPGGLAVVAEAFVSNSDPADELDSLAAWPTEDGSLRLFATAKRTHRLLEFDGDTGEQLRTIGGPGAGPGRFTRPNGLAVHGDLLFVSERDNGRVQVLHLPDAAPLGTFGEDELRSPYGVWAHEPAPGEIDVYVTDSFMEGARFEIVPPLEQLDQRVRRYRLRPDDADGFDVQALGTFGATDEANALRIVESLAGDPPFDRLLIADEDRRHAQTVHEYTLDGRPTGRSIARGTFLGEPEGIALWACTADKGYWLVADQLQPLTIFRLFERHTLAPGGEFTGAITAWTDGIALHAAATPRFPHGVLYAVHDDKAVVAFDLADIARALRLDPDCAG
jgi:3-phytase